MSSDSEIAEFYAGRSLFVTGGTGFMGKVLLEKLLYVCPKIEKIYVLMRPKRGKSIEQRMQEMGKIPLFSRIQKECPERLEKLVPVFGDVTLDELGLHHPDRCKILDEVSVVIHGAATLRLEAKLNDAVKMNTEGTLTVMNFCREIKNLKVVVHVSTAFCHVDQLVMEEKVYDSGANPRDVIDLCHWMDNKSLDIVTPSLIAPHPNSYTYSKRLAESVVNSFYPELPVVIVRPSIVTPSYLEPMDGWVDNLNGPTGLLVGGAKGVIRSMHCNPDYLAEIIPVDMAISGIVAIAWKTATSEERPEDIPVFNLTQSGTNIVSWGEVLELGKKCVYEYPCEVMLWYPNGDTRRNKYVHDAYVLFTHWIPAFIIDFLMIVFGQKPFMVKIQRRIQDGLNVLQYFTTRQWRFKNEKLLKLRESLSERDRETFNMEFEKVEREPYMKSCILGARHYILKEDPATIPRSRKILKIFWLVDKLATALLFYVLFWMVMSFSSTARATFDAFKNAVPFMRTVKI